MTDMSDLKERLRADLTAAMKAREAFGTSVLRMALAAIQTEEVAGKAARELSDSEVQAVVTREVRKRRESAEAYAAGNRPELAEKEAAEADFLAAYLPKGLSDAEVDAIIAKALSEVAAATGEEPSIRQLGQVMKLVSAEVQGRADGGAVAARVKAKLA